MGQEKTSIVVSIAQNYRNYEKGGQQVFVHKIKMQNGEEGDYRTPSPICDYFEENKEITYDMATYPRKFGSGVDVVFSKPKMSSSSPSRKGGGGGQQRNESVISAQHAIGRAVELVCNGKLELKEMYNKAQEILNWTSKAKPQ
jgi:hypothetical protein